MSYEALAVEAARRHGIPEDLFLRLIQQESGWQPNVVSPAGAIGLAQLMPGTAGDLGVDPNDPAQNLEGGARYLAQQYAAFGDWPLALAAYNAGPGAVRKHGGVPPYRETQNYVAALTGGGGGAGQGGPPVGGAPGGFTGQGIPPEMLNALIAILEQQQQQQQAPQEQRNPMLELSMFRNPINALIAQGGVRG